MIRGGATGGDDLIGTQLSWAISGNGSPPASAIAICPIPAIRRRRGAFQGHQRMQTTDDRCHCTLIAAAAPALAQTAPPAPGKPATPAACRASSTRQPKAAAARPRNRARQRRWRCRMSRPSTKARAQRIREAALSYSDIAVRGGWPTIPADAKFAIGRAGANDDLLRKRLIISGDLADDKTSGAFDDDVAEAVKRFQVRHGLAPTGTVTPRTIAALNVSVQKRIKQLEASLERLEQTEFRVRPALCRGQPPRDLRGGRRERQGGAALSRHRRQDRKALADPDGRDHRRRAQPDLDRAVLDRENRNLRAYAQRPELSLAHAHGSAGRA